MTKRKQRSPWYCQTPQIVGQRLARAFSSGACDSSTLNFDLLGIGSCLPISPYSPAGQNALATVKVSNSTLVIARFSLFSPNTSGRYTDGQQQAFLNLLSHSGSQVRNAIEALYQRFIGFVIVLQQVPLFIA